jgi:hypothetical protein
VAATFTSFLKIFTSCGWPPAGCAKRPRFVDPGGDVRTDAPEEYVSAVARYTGDYPVWENLVIQFRVSGKPAHDARLVAAMQVHGLTAILTFDRTGFSRYAGVEVVHPADAAG